MAAMSRIWHVTVQNMPETYEGARLDPDSRIAFKFTLHSMPGLPVEGFEEAMKMELINAVRKIKKEMIMKGMEP